MADKPKTFKDEKFSAGEIAARLKAIAGRLGPEASASIVLSSGSTGDGRTVYASIEASWRQSRQEEMFRTDTLAEAFAALSAWVNEAPIRNRVATAADLGIAA